MRHHELAQYCRSTPGNDERSGAMLTARTRWTLILTQACHQNGDFVDWIILADKHQQKNVTPRNMERHRRTRAAARERHRRSQNYKFWRRYAVSNDSLRSTFVKTSRHSFPQIAVVKGTRSSEDRATKDASI